ncbi:MAG: type II toxin-antitoxin system HicB family antitoxin [Anaerolineae bacterium]
MTPEPETGYTVTVPALPGCVTHGATIAEAIAMANEVFPLFCESLEAHSEAVPNELQLDEAAIDRIVIAQADDADAWEALIPETTPLKQVVSVMELHN